MDCKAVNLSRTDLFHCASHICADPDELVVPTLRRVVNASVRGTNTCPPRRR